MRGDRFKRRLPKFVGRISDMDDLFFAEDQEFDRIERLIWDFTYGLYVSSIGKTSNPDFFLSRLERDYGLESAGTVEERITAILLKMQGKRTTTEQVILEICEAFGTPGKYYPKYEDYMFYLDLWANGGLDMVQLDKALREIIPAHLDYMVRLNYGKQLTLESRTGDDSYKIWLCGEHNCGEIPYTYVVGDPIYVGLGVKGGRFDSENRWGLAGEGYLSGELNRDKNVELRYVQNFNRDSVYDFGGDIGAEQRTDN